MESELSPMTETESQTGAADLPAGTDDTTTLEPGIYWNATVTEIGDDAVTVDLGDDTLGYFPAGEARAAGGGALVKAGDSIEVLVDDLSDDGSWVVSMEKAEKLRVFERLVQLAKKRAVVQGVVTRHIRAGLSVDIGVKALLPNRDSGFRPHELPALVGTTIKAQVIKFDRRKGEVVLSRRKIAERDAEVRQAQLMSRIEVGDIVKGSVVSIRDFGAFVDLGGADGLIHVSEMAWDKGLQPKDVLSVGDEVEVLIKEIDTQRGRIGLSLKALRDNPWDKLAGQHTVGSKTKGKVSSITDFGIFVTIGGVDGLVHVSELTWEKESTDPNSIASVGDEIEVVVKEVDTSRQRLSLSIKQLLPNPWQAGLGSLEVGQRVTGAITSVVDFGVFVQVAPGVEGLLHCGDMTWEKRISKPSEFRKFQEGEDVEVIVISIEADRQRVGLGIKQLDGDPWEEAGAELKKGGTLTVTITRLEKFGAFAQIVPGLEGLIHISEVAVDRVENLRHELRTGQEVKVKVLEADRRSRKVGLSIKRLLMDEGEGIREHVEEDEGGTSLGDLLKKSGHIED
jgi:small subunit ribosomal protein S1